MNDYLINELIKGFDIKDRIAFFESAKLQILDDEIFTKEIFKIYNIDLTFTLLVSICTYLNNYKNDIELTNQLKKIKLRKIYFLACLNLTEEEKYNNRILINNLYKEYYELCEKCHWNERKLELLTKKVKTLDKNIIEKYTFNEIVILNELQASEIIQYGAFYSSKIIGKIRNKINRELMNKDEYEFFDMVVKDAKIDEIANYLENNINLSTRNKIVMLIPKFIENYSVVENVTNETVLKKIEDKINSKLDMIITYQKDRKAKTNKKVEVKKTLSEQATEEAKKNIELYIRGNYRNIKRYCSDMEIKISIFKKYVRIVAQNNPELYKTYQDKLKTHQELRYTLITDDLLKLSNYIKNGIQLEDKTIKEFDLLDFYLLNIIPLSNIRNLLNCEKIDIDVEDLKVIRDFLNKYIRQKRIIKQSVFREKNIVLINNIEHEITYEEKQKAIEYLETNKIPLTNITYKLSLNRVIYNLSCEKQKTIKLTSQ